MLRDHRHKRIVKRTVKIAIHNHFGTKARATSRVATEGQTSRNRPEPATKAEAGNGNRNDGSRDSRNDGHRGQYDPGLETYDGKSRIALILAVEKATDYDRTDPHCPSCGLAKGEMVVFMVAGGNVCRACPSCFVEFDKRA
ncbi:hypothetical protein SAMN05444166_0160 [Singulisphaera sp. GP187]|uniref:hypothetical protein n=1 Tax=Singulisphaera sp. GP187 TaxID=1882752 RepID=UPI00092A254E|nr:hypothetical protein [Singulisphaera sp. GP187]SIN69244.1 hypothetical protein SAMN05444166_0160 [Singulisphaera sp. GP187]